MCRGWGAQGGEDVFGLGGQGVGGGEVVAVEVDGDVLEGFEGAYDALDADSGGVLEVARRRSSAARPPTGPPARSCYGLSPDAPRSGARHPP